MYEEDLLDQYWEEFIEESEVLKIKWRYTNQKQY